MHHADVAIVGAGMVGCACADRLVRDGLRVTVIDPEPPGSGATAAGMGHIMVTDDSEAQFALTSYSRDLWDEMAADLPASAERVVAGTLWVASDEQELDACHSKAGFYKARGIHAEVLDEKSLASAEPNLRRGFVGGLRIPGDSIVYPPVVAAWLLNRAVATGRCKVVRRRAVAIDPPRVMLDDGSAIESPAIVNACGAWAPRLTPGLPIRRKKGHLVITDRYPGFCFHELIELAYLKNAHASNADSVSFNLQPRGTGQLLIGSSRQFDRVDPENPSGPPIERGPEVEDAMVEKIVARAISFMPGIAKMSAIRVWTGFRAATPDSLPLIGRHPQIEGLWLATGHEGLGITTSLGTAEVLGDLMAGRAAKIPAAPYSPAREMKH